MNHVPPPSASMDNREAILTSVDRMEFISLLSRMLTLDPTQRIRPLAALQTPFITMQHLAMHTNTQTVWEWIQAMSVCHQPRLSTTPIVTPLATPIATPLAGLQHNPLQLLSHPNGGIPSAAACCRQIQQAPPTLSSTTALYPTAVIPHNGTHLVSHAHTQIGSFIVIFFRYVTWLRLRLATFRLATPTLSEGAVGERGNRGWNSNSRSNCWQPVTGSYPMLD